MGTHTRLQSQLVHLATRSDAPEERAGRRKVSFGSQSVLKVLASLRPKDIMNSGPGQQINEDLRLRSL
jgi:hypothetical protein